MAVTLLPKFVMLKHKSFEHSFFSYKDGTVLAETEMGVHNPLAKIEVEKAKINGDYVHLRFTHTNKYWSRKDGFIVAESTKPEEDVKKSTCTMFKATGTADAGVFQLVHVQSGFFVQSKTTSSQVEVVKDASESSKLSFVDSETIVLLPNRLALKSNNGKFLKSVDDSNHSLEFTSDDHNARSSAQEIQALPSGQIRIKSVFYDKFWRRVSDGDGLIYVVSGEKETSDKDSLFWPVKLSEKTIALRSVGNDNGGGARFEVRELVRERKIYDVKYRLEEARIYDVEPLVAGSVTLRNEGDKEASLSEKVVYEEVSSYGISRRESVTAELKVTFEASLSKVVDFKFEVGRRVSEELEWEKINYEKVTKEPMATTDVPARTSVKISYIGSKGKYTIPFSYSQSDVDSATALPTITKHTDGIYHGQGSLELKFVAGKPVPL
ncbi:uncharacterized protein LOC125206936 [Salvia hispanica]|uniref:uncharacterized protein LOC125206936 n=1 Tax=Salvia hispanica TaxID=49212 RepID=UPI0020098E44|nr:uncharacterized protein LOC125206936 [Salvia hispanica]